MLWIGLALFICILFLVWMIIRSYNAPKVAKEKAEIVKARQDGWVRRICARRGTCDPKVEKEKSVKAGLKIIQRIRERRHGN